MAQRGKRVRTRREFLVDGAKLAAGAALGSIAACFPDVGGSWAPLKPECTSSGGPPFASDGKVVEVHSAGVLGAYIGSPWNRYPVDPVVVRNMLDTALGALAGTATPWRTLLDPLPANLDELTIGLKVNTLGSHLCTAPELLKAVVDSLKQELGLPAERIVVWDRTQQELDVFADLGLSSAALGATVQGTCASASDPSGPGYDEAMCGAVAGKAPQLSRIHTKLTSFTINCPLLKRHTASGVTGAMKNVYGIIHNPADYHLPGLHTALPQLYALPLVGPRIRLNILDALNTVAFADTSSTSDSAPARILVSKDPVAIDSRGFDLINQVRVAKSQKPVAPGAVAWLDNADGVLGLKSYNLVSLEV